MCASPLSRTMFTATWRKRLRPEFWSVHIVEGEFHSYHEQSHLICWIEDVTSRCVNLHLGSLVEEPQPMYEPQTPSPPPIRQQCRCERLHTRVFESYKRKPALNKRSEYVIH
ncbi:hypothetical protein O6H91_15G050500 [Diphasiastrum complanatum]|uniref:Uncharacterized protein n=1 Tax=Diphasiastrum complanatum TaxID=34168 RepID=A0ACC2BI57_DIPCM|nr:hypothetical protein O6H91_Y216300 [Diphasiastrum complanatum]KAJ7529443.1 hypothetical protein O6H91_15G050500 [Diphasiastrum complanatum]